LEEGQEILGSCEIKPHQVPARGKVDELVEVCLIKFPAIEVTRDQREKVKKGRRIIIIIGPIRGALGMKGKTDLAVSILGIDL
jgi:hypothetical protein